MPHSPVRRLPSDAGVSLRPHNKDNDNDEVDRVGDHEEKDRDVVEDKGLGSRLPGEETLLCPNSGVHPLPRRQAGLKDCEGECE